MIFYEKDKIIYHILEYFDTKEIDNICEAKENLKKLAKRYNFKIKEKRSLKIDLRVALKEFAINRKGVTVTIPQLYNSL